VWTFRRTAKKLIVAFHFQLAGAQLADRAGWDCDSCRRTGLEQKRRCGFLPAEERGEPRIVWGRKQVSSQECPKSFVTGESMALLEEYFVRARLGILPSMETEARKADAFVILRDLMEREENDGTPQH
jgi:hypothetical protein